MPEDTNSTVLKNPDTTIRPEVPVIQEGFITDQLQQDSVTPFLEESLVDTSADIPDTIESALPPDDENEVVTPADQTSSA